MYFLRPRSEHGVVENKRVLNPSLWSSLPDDLVERVLTKVPFSTLVKCRVVCKKWNELILSGSFIPSTVHNPKYCPFLFTYYTPRSQESSYFTVYDSKRHNWVDLSLSFLKLDPDLGNWELVVSAGGLLCLASISCSQLVVCNPVTKSWRMLGIPEKSRTTRWLSPSRPAGNYIVGLVVDQETGYYLLVLVKIYGKSHGTTRIYDSLKCAWRTGSTMPGKSKRRSWKIPGVVCNGSVYWISDGEVYRHSRLFKYDIENDEWRVMVLWTCREIIGFIEHRDELLVMTDSGDAYAVHERNQKASMVSKRMPKPLMEKLHRNVPEDSGRNVSYIGVGNMICYVREFQVESTYRTRLDFTLRDFSSASSTSTAQLEYGYVKLCWVLETSLAARA